MRKKADGANRSKSLENHFRTPLLLLEFFRKNAQSQFLNSNDLYCPDQTMGPRVCLGATYQRRKKRISKIQFWWTENRMHVVRDGVGEKQFY